MAENEPQEITPHQELLCRMSADIAGAIMSSGEYPCWTVGGADAKEYALETAVGIAQSLYDQVVSRTVVGSPWKERATT